MQLPRGFKVGIDRDQDQFTHTILSVTAGNNILLLVYATLSSSILFWAPLTNSYKK